MTLIRSTVHTDHEPSDPLAGGHQAEASRKPVFGRPMRNEHFAFAPTYKPLNHGSYGTSPRPVLAAREKYQREFEARECIFKRFTYPQLLLDSRAAVAPLLGASVAEVVFLPNATTGINTVLRNLTYAESDVVLHFSSIYPACLKTVLHVGESTPLRPRGVEVLYPIEDEELVARFRAAAEQVAAEGKRVKLAMFDTIVSGPGVRVPWEDLVAVCSELGILSLVDGAHGIGHIDMRHTSEVSPDFLVTNCHKWLFSPRGSAVLYVPERNHHLIRSTIPTSHGYEPPTLRKPLDPSAYFAKLFVDVATLDNSAFLCVREALRFRAETCGGEEAIHEYCLRLAREGGDRAATILGTEVLDNNAGTLRRCAFANVRLPLEFTELTSDELRRRWEPRKVAGVGSADALPLKDAQAIWEWMYERAAVEFDTYLQIMYYRGWFWVRFSAQVYLELEDIEWGAKRLLELCDRAKQGEWRSREMMEDTRSE